MHHQLIEPLEARIAPATLSINNVSLVEGDSGETDFVFTVNLSRNAQDTAEVTVDFHTVDGSATRADNDYLESLGTLTFAPNETMKTITVKVIGDEKAEANEAFSVSLTNPTTGTTIETGTGTGTIYNGLLSIDDQTIVEGNSGTSKMSFNVTLTGADFAQDSKVSVPFAVTPNSAGFADFDPPTGSSLVFTENGTKTIDVNIKGDTVTEAHEIFFLNLQDTSTAGITKSQGIGKILNDDAVTVSIANAPGAYESTGKASFVVSLDGGVRDGVTIHYKTNDGTGDKGATSPADFNGVPGTITFDPDGPTSKTIDVVLVDDKADESSENFSVELTTVDATPATTAVSLSADHKIGTGTILNDDLNVNITGVTKAEGNSGLTDYTFTVFLSDPHDANNTDVTSEHDVIVNFATNDGTATIADADYITKTGTVTIPHGQHSATVTISVLGDFKQEAGDSENFSLVISNVQEAWFGDANTATKTAQGVIVDDDPTVTVNDVTVTEGDGGTVTAVFTVSISAVPETGFKVKYTTAGGTASNGLDYVNALGELEFTPSGPTSQTVSVTVNGDRIREVTENFFLNLEKVDPNAPFSIGDAQGMASIKDNDDPAPTISIGDIAPLSLYEGADGTSKAVFTVTLSEVANENVTVYYATKGGTAVAGSDFTAKTDSFVIPAGSKSGTVEIQVLGDAVDEVDEKFSLEISKASMASYPDLQITNAVGNATILNDDVTVSIESPAIFTEPDTGTSDLHFVVKLSKASDHDVTVQYTTADGTGVGAALAGKDYTTTKGSVTILAGQTSADVSIPVVGDLTYEVFSVNGVDKSDETFSVRISQSTDPLAPTNAKIDAANSVATGTIHDNDPVPTISIVNAVTVAEDKGSAVFTVNLSAASTKDITVHYKTADSTAVDGKGSPDPNDPDVIIPDVFPSDFTYTEGTLTIPAGQTSGTFSVAIVSDTRDEADEQFTATLSAPTNAVLDSDPTHIVSIATITDDDAAPIITIDDAKGIEGTDTDGKIVFKVHLSQPSEKTITMDVFTSDGTAVAGSDYIVKVGTLTIDPKSPGGDVEVTLVKDGVNEGDERFFLNLANATNATIGDNQAVGTIQNDESQFKVILVDDKGDELSSSSILEGNPGDIAKTVKIKVTRTDTTDAASVNYSTVIGSGDKGATSGGARPDFTTISGTVDFLPGQVSKIIDQVISITPDKNYENNETFTVELSNPINGAILGTDGAATVTIVNDDERPQLIISDAEGTETGSLVFKLQLSAANEVEDVEAKFATVDKEAISIGDEAKRDFIAAVADSKVTIAKGSTTGTITIGIRTDARDEYDETFELKLTELSDGATFSTTEGDAVLSGDGKEAVVTGTILDDDAEAVVNIKDLSIGENESAIPGTGFEIQLVGETDKVVKVTVHIDDKADGTTAKAGDDYTLVAPMEFVFQPGETSKRFSVPINDDTLYEGSVPEIFHAYLDAPENATLGDRHAVGSIVDNDVIPPALAINNVQIVEGDNGKSFAVFTVTLSAPSDKEVTVDWATADGTAKATGPFADYIQEAGKITFAPLQTVETFQIEIINDLIREEVAEQDGNNFNLVGEKFFVNLSNATGATIADGQGEGTILNGGDTTIGIAVSDVAVVEGNSGDSTATFTVLLSAPPTANVTFDAATRNGTAVQTSDFTALLQTFTFLGTHADSANPSTTLPGEVVKSVAVAVKGDGNFEATESFFVDFSNFSANVTPVGVDSRGQLHARGTIYNDDIQSLNGGKTIQWIDVDGDLVTLTITKGILSLSGTDDLTLVDSGTVGGKQLQLLDLSNDNGAFFGTNITIKAEKQPGFTGVSDGRVDVGEIRAAFALPGELQFVGSDLGVVTVDGDLAQITAGDSFSTPAISKLDVYSFGARGFATMVPDSNQNGRVPQSDILGPIGTVHVTTTLEGNLHVIGAEFGNIGTLKVDGAIKGGSIADSGQVSVTGRISNLIVGDIIGGSGARSGLVFGDFQTNGVIGTVKINGTLQGGIGSNSGQITASSIGAVTVGKIVGGSAEGSGSIVSNLGITSLTVKGDIVGGTQKASGEVFAGGNMGAVKIGGNVIGGAGEQSGVVIAGGKMASAAVTGVLKGGAGAISGVLRGDGGMGAVTIGKNTAGESIIGGSGSDSGEIFGTGKVTSVTTLGSIVGGTGDASGIVFVNGSLGKLDVRGSLLGGNSPGNGDEGTGAKTLIRSGYIYADVIGTAVIAGNVESGINNGLGLASSGSIRADVINSLTIKGNVIGNADSPVVISANGFGSNLAIKALTIEGNVQFAEILAGYSPEVTAGTNFRGVAQNADAQIGTITIGKTANNTVKGLNIVAGAVAGSGGRFGDATDVLASGAVQDNAKVISSIASVIIKGMIETNTDTYGIVAQHIMSVKLGTVPLAGLTKGPGNDLAIGSVDQSDPIGYLDDTDPLTPDKKFRAVELFV